MNNEPIEPHTMKRDYEYAFIIGIIISIFLYPTERNLGLLSSTPFIYIASFFAMPLLALAGIAIARLLFSRSPGLWQFVKFGLIGVSNTIINFGVYNYLINWTGTTAFTAKIYLALFSALAFFAAFINSYIWNSHWAFASKQSRTVSEFEKFFLITLCGVVINSAVIFFVSKAQPMTISFKLWANIANLWGSFITLFWNFIGFKFIVFKNPEK